MFGFLKTNHEARRDEVRRSSWRGWPPPPRSSSSRRPGRRRAGLHAGQHPCAGCRARGRPRRRAGPDADADRGRAAYLYEVAARARRVVRSLRRRGPGGAGLRRVRRPGLRPPSPRSSGASVTGRPRPSRLLRTFHRGPACRRAPDPALDPRFPAVAAACRDAAGARRGICATPAGRCERPGRIALGLKEKRPTIRPFPHPGGLTRRLSPGGLFTAVHSRPLYASVCLAPGAPA